MILVDKCVNYDNPGERSPEKDCLTLYLTVYLTQDENVSQCREIALLRTTLTQMIIIYVLLI